MVVDFTSFVWNVVLECASITQFRFSVLGNAVLVYF